MIVECSVRNECFDMLYFSPTLLVLLYFECFATVLSSAWWFWPPRWSLVKAAKATMEILLYGRVWTVWPHFSFSTTFRWRLRWTSDLKCRLPKVASCLTYLFQVLATCNIVISNNKWEYIRWSMSIWCNIILSASLTFCSNYVCVACVSFGCGSSCKIKCLHATDGALMTAYYMWFI